MEGKTDCWDRMMHSWVLEGEESWGRRTRRRNGGREGRGGYRVHGRGAETEPKGRRKGGRWGGEEGGGESVWPETQERKKGAGHRDAQPGCLLLPRRLSAQGGPTTVPLEPPGVSTITTGAPTFHTHASTHLPWLHLMGTLATSHAPPAPPDTAPA